jgi:O-antigen ligase
MIAFAVKSLAFALVLAAVGFLTARQSAPTGELKARALVWLLAFCAALACGFLTPGFWPGMFVLGLIALAFGRVEPLAPAAYLVLLYCLPPFGKEIPGVGGINYFFSLSPPLLLALTLLAPYAAFSGRRPPRIGAAALLLGLYAVLCIALEARGRSLTDAVRAAFMIAALIAPIFLAFTRGAADLAGARRIAFALVATVGALSALGLFETFRGYRLFGAVIHNWAMDLLTPYSYRQGFLRAAAGVYDPIAFGAFAGLALTLAPFALGGRIRNFAGYALIALFCAGLIASLSRGPWIATAAAILLAALAAPRSGAVVARLGGAGLVGLLVLAATPVGRVIFNLLPVVGDPADDTIGYRRELAAAGWRVARKHLWFGSPDYLSDPELQALRQGQGIIDVVNHYVELLLRYGLVGLSFFVLINLLALWAAWRAARASRRSLPEYNLACRSMMAGLFLLLSLFAMTSATQQLNQTHWVMLSATLAVAAMTRAALAAQPQAQTGTAESAAPDPEAAPAASAAALEDVDPARVPAHLRQYVRRPD